MPPSPVELQHGHLKNTPLHYNREDCEAFGVVANALVDLDREVPADGKSYILRLRLGRRGVEISDHGISGCCARAASGHAVAPTITDTNSRQGQPTRTIKAGCLNRTA
jgi:hypothetical protein